MTNGRCIAAALGTVMVVSTTAAAQERAYFVTYDHYLEEPGNLEIGVSSTTGMPRADQAAYTAPWLELEYGVTGWWTAELYLEGVIANGDGNAFVGWRWENRFRPLRSEHRFNPVLYVEYEDTSEASRIQKEIVGSGSLAFEPIAALTQEHTRELEGKLILSSVAGSWNISENLIVEKNLSEEEGVEFGYSVGVLRSVGTLASSTVCHFCAENFTVGVEAYGGLGSTQGFAAGEQRHFVAPVLGWRVTPRTTFRTSIAFGLTEASDPLLVRFGLSFELPLGRLR